MNIIAYVAYVVMVVVIILEYFQAGFAYV